MLARAVARNAARLRDARPKLKNQNAPRTELRVIIISMAPRPVPGRAQSTPGCRCYIIALSISALPCTVLNIWMLDQFYRVILVVVEPRRIIGIEQFVDDEGKVGGVLLMV